MTAPLIAQICAVFVAASLLAIAGARSVSLWTDEAVTASAARRTWPELWAMLQNIDAVHGAYYAFMKVWVDVFGTSDIALRAPSALAVGGTAVGVLLLTRRIADARTALVAAALCALLPRLTWAGIEARPYAFTALLATWSTLLLVDAVQRPRARRWVLYVALSVLGVLVNVYLALLVVAHGITVLLRYRSRRAVLTFVVAGGVTALLVLPLLALTQAQQSQVGGGGPRGPVTIARMALVNQAFLGGTPSPEAAPLWFDLAWRTAAVAAAAVGVALICLACVRGLSRSSRASQTVAVCVPWVVVPTAVIGGYAIAVAPLYRAHYLTFAAPAIAILLAGGVTQLRRRSWRVLVVAALVTLFACVYVSQRVPGAKSGSDWQDVAAYVAAEARDGDAVYFVARYPYPGTTDQVTSRRIAEAYPDAFDGLDDLTLKESGPATGTIDGYSVRLGAVRDDLATHTTVWLIHGEKAPEQLVEQADRELVRAGFAADTGWSGRETTVTKYVRPQQ